MRRALRTISAASVRSLLIHQRNGYDGYMLQHRHWALLMEMRLGKTLLTIRGIVRDGGTQSNIVMAPATVLVAWSKELRTEGESYIVASGLTMKKRQEAIFWAQHPEPGCRRWLLINYESVRATPVVVVMEWSNVVADESVCLSNPKAAITKLCLTGFRDAGRRIILSGLVCPEGDFQVFTQMCFLHGSFMGFDNYYKWLYAYFIQDYGTNSWRPQHQYKALVKASVHNQSYIVRRADVSMGGRKIYERKIIPMAPEQKRLYKEIEKTWNALGEEGTVKSDTMYAIVVSGWLRRIAGGFSALEDVNNPGHRELLSSAKADELLHDLQGNLKYEKVVVWFAHREELQYVSDRLKKVLIGHVIIHGDVPIPQREGLLGRFTDDPVTITQVVLATESCAKYGNDMSVAQTAIYYSNEWSCNARAQSEDRIIHPVLKKDLLIIDYITAGTVDEEVVDAVKSKVADAVGFMKVLRALRKEKE